MTIEQAIHGLLQSFFILGMSLGVLIGLGVAGIARLFRS